MLLRHDFRSKTQVRGAGLKSSATSAFAEEMSGSAVDSGLIVRLRGLGKRVPGGPLRGNPEAGASGSSEPTRQVSMGSCRRRKTRRRWAADGVVELTVR